MYINRNTVLFLNGRWLKATDAMGNLFSQSLHYGNGVFDGLRAYETGTGPHLFKAREHFNRLHYSAAKMSIDLNYTADELIEIAYQLLEKNDLGNAYVRPLVCLGDPVIAVDSREVYFLMAAWQWERFPGNDLLRVMVSSYKKPAPDPLPLDAKICGHYTSSVMATMEAKSKGFDEALLLDLNGYVTEGPGVNFFFEKDEVLYTPPRRTIFPGITRATVIGYAREMGYRVVEKKFTAEELMEADTAFFTGTAAEIAGIRSIGGHDFTMEWEDTVAYSLFLMYRQRVVNNEYRDFTLV